MKRTKASTTKEVSLLSSLKLKEPKWSIEHVEKFSAKDLTLIKEIRIKPTQYEGNNDYPQLKLKDGRRADLPQLDIECQAEVGDKLDPESFEIRTLRSPDGEKTIRRSYGEVL